VGAAALAVLLLLAALVISTPSLPVLFDLSIHQWVVAHRPTVLIHIATVVTWFGATIIVLPLVLVGAVLTTSGRLPDRLRLAVIPVAIMASGLIVRPLIADTFGRSRPPVTDWATGASGYAFPSGHTPGGTRHPDGRGGCGAASPGCQRRRATVVGEGCLDWLARP